MAADRKHKEEKRKECGENCFIWFEQKIEGTRLSRRERERERERERGGGGGEEKEKESAHFVSLFVKQ